MRSETDVIARAGYTAWSSRQPDDQPRTLWSSLTDAQREPWRRAGLETTARECWEARFAGYAKDDWDRQPVQVHLVWTLVTLAMERARWQGRRRAA